MTTTDSAGGTGARSLIRDLMRLPDEVRRAMRPALRSAAAPVLAGAQASAGAWSRRIPAAMSMRVSFAGSRPGVFITVSKAKAPHARPFEGLVRSSWRHPVFGDYDEWVEQTSRPFLVPSLESNEGNAWLEIRRGVDEALARANLA